MEVPALVKEEQCELVQGSVGSAVPMSAWETRYTTVAWTVKWAARKGLQPVRPVVLWKRSGKTVIKPGEAVPLNA